MTAALGTLSSIALFDGEEHALHNRVAKFDEDIYYDLTDADWRAVRIDRNGWEIEDHPPFCSAATAIRGPRLNRPRR